MAAGLAVTAPPGAEAEISKLAQMPDIDAAEVACRPNYALKALGNKIYEEPIGYPVRGWSLNVVLFDDTGSQLQNIVFAVYSFEQLDRKDAMLRVQAALQNVRLMDQDRKPIQISKAAVQQAIECPPFFSLSKEKKASYTHALLWEPPSLFSFGSDEGSFSEVVAMSMMALPGGEGVASSEPPPETPDITGPTPADKSKGKAPEVASKGGLGDGGGRTSGGDEKEKAGTGIGGGTGKSGKTAKTGSGSGSSIWGPSVASDIDPDSLPAPGSKTKRKSKSEDVASLPDDEGKISGPKSYPAPDYPRLRTSGPLARPQVPGRGVPVFALEKVECSPQGNWILGYFGFIKELAGDDVLVVVKKRYASNNYPGESRAKPDDTTGASALGGKAIDASCIGSKRGCGMGSTVKAVCDPDRTCVRVERTSDNGVVKLAVLWSGTRESFAVGDGAGGEQAAGIVCSKERGLCFKSAVSQWACDPRSGACYSTRPDKWWCEPRKEFCYSQVPFGDWGSELRENSIFKVKAADVFDLGFGFVPVLQDVVMRQCGATAAKSAGG